jgi:hypothetical protein
MSVIGSNVITEIEGGAGSAMATDSAEAFRKRDYSHYLPASYPGAENTDQVGGSLALVTGYRR